jgi:hypothetical protein
MLTEVVESNDVWMDKRGGGAGLALETLAKRDVSGTGTGKELDCNAATKSRVVGAVHFPPAATAEIAGDAIAPQQSSHGKRA